MHGAYPSLVQALQLHNGGLGQRGPFILDLGHVCWDCLHSFVDLDTAQFNLAVNQVNNGGNLKSSTKKGTAQQCALKMCIVLHQHGKSEVNVASF